MKRSQEQRQQPGVPHVVVDITDDSMAPNYAEGERALCAAGTDIQDGGPCQVQFIDADAPDVFRRVYDLGDGRVKLVADNPAYEPVIVPREQIRSIKVANWKLTPSHMLRPRAE